MKNVSKVFEDSIADLCKTLTPEKIKQLDFILTQEKDEEEIIKEIVEKFPHFKIIYVARLAG
ncbi:MAG: hypothetical protein UX25_C0049G0004 [Candidatus Woesebacteria bacterium GW2011_GWC2_45_9]|nr:MAG: hypothetical protein UX25_C0049G0004 [Candidatus Woesebacteria bacterium GW2011_GWC2_45_9]